MSPSVWTANVTWLPLLRPVYTASTMAWAAENGKLCPKNPVTVPNIFGPETEAVRPSPFWLVRVTWLPCTEPCSDTSLAWPEFRSAAALRPLTAIATVTWSPLLRPAYRACSGAAVAVAGADEVAGADDVAGTAAAVLVADFPATVLAHRKTTAKITTEPSVIRGPRLLIPGYRLSVADTPVSPAGPPGAAAGETRVAVGKRNMRCGRYGLAAGAGSGRPAAARLAAS